jgi:hypothetical protein
MTMLRKRPARLALIGMFAVVGLTAAACAPSAGIGAPPAPINWSFKGTSVKVNSSQDKVCVIFCVNTRDEPYLYQIAFRVRIGQANSADAWVVKGDAHNDVGEGETYNVVGGEQAKVSFTGVQPLDVLDALNPSNKMDIVGTYTWASEEDTINSLQSGAEAVANLFKTALNSTLATGTLPNGDTSALVSQILGALFTNPGNLFGLLGSNIPLFGLGDDVLGGAVYIGIGATGTLAAAIDAAAASATIPAISIPVVDIPPDVVGGGIYTMGGSKNFSQTFTGSGLTGGQHVWTFQSGPA